MMFSKLVETWDQISLKYHFVESSSNFPHKSLTSAYSKNDVESKIKTKKVLQIINVIGLLALWFSNSSTEEMNTTSACVMYRFKKYPTFHFWSKTILHNPVICNRCKLKLLSWQYQLDFVIKKIRGSSSGRVWRVVCRQFHQLSLYSEDVTRNERYIQYTCKQFCEYHSRINVT